MIRRPPSLKRRSATTVVEFAFIAIIFFTVLFGIFEYARFVFLLQVTDAAAREGARFAAAHTGDGTTTQNVIDQVNYYMSSRSSELQGYTVTVTCVDPTTGNQITIPNTSPTQYVTWNNAAFGQVIAVTITGNYSPILPGLLLTSSPIPISRTVIMNSEAN
jgi:Flp pilus assembly protein TadG